MIKRPLQILTLALLAVVAGIPAPPDRAFQWPDSSRYWRALVNVNQYIETYVRRHPEWFSRDKLVTDLIVLEMPQGGQQQAYKRVRKLLESKGMYVGTYVSGTTVQPAQLEKRYPRRVVPLDQMPASARYVGLIPKEDERKIIDISDVETRHALEAGIRKLWESFPAPIRFMDNMPPHPRLKGPPWNVTCQYITELGQIGTSVGSRLIFNMAMHVGELSDEETQQLIKAVGQNGLALEMPWSDAIRTSKAATDRAEKRYRQLLDSGMAIILIPVKTPQDQLTQWVRSWRKPTDHIYMADSFFKQPDMSVYMLQ